jgi:5'-3' exoribonuclease 2
MVEAVCRVVDHLFALVRPRRMLYIAIDGVAPRAKMNQQRARRFRAVRDSADHRRDEDEARSAAGMPPRAGGATAHWDTNAITPGTPFMGKVARGVRQYVEARLDSDPAWSDVRVLFSSASTPGEGEHKIMDFIRRQRHAPGYDPQTSHVVYGLDADLIMLALASHEPNFTLLREDRPIPPRYLVRLAPQ